MYKVVRCRYFNDSGGPIKPYCPKGDFCRFIHPSDASWGSGRPSRHDAGSGIHSEDRASYPRSRTAMNSSNPQLSAKPRSSPLLPQADLFKREIEHDVGPLREPNIGYGRHGGVEKQPERLYDRRSYLGVEKPDDRFDSGPAGREKVLVKQGNARERRSDQQSNTAFSDYEKGNSNISVIAQNKDIRSEKALQPNRASTTTTGGLPLQETGLDTVSTLDTDKIINLFQGIATLSNNVIHDSATVASEEKKLKNYNDLSTTLSKFSPLAASAISSAVTDIVARQEKGKELIERDLKALDQAWKDMFAVFVKDATREIGSAMEDALAAVKKQGEHTIKFIASSNAAAHSRQRMSINRAMPNESNSHVELGGEREVSRNTECEAAPVDPRHGDEGNWKERKRRRFVSGPHHGDMDHRQEKRMKVEDNGRLGNASSKIALDEMKEQMAKQAERLQVLAKENEQLRHVIKNQTPSTPSISFNRTTSNQQHTLSTSQKFPPFPTEHFVTSNIDIFHGSPSVELPQWRN